jgi:hypothetical protein
MRSPSTSTTVATQVSEEFFLSTASNFIPTLKPWGVTDCGVRHGNSIDFNAFYNSRQLQYSQRDFWVLPETWLTWDKKTKRTFPWWILQTEHRNNWHSVEYNVYNTLKFIKHWSLILLNKAKLQIEVQRKCYCYVQCLPVSSWLWRMVTPKSLTLRKTSRPAVKVHVNSPKKILYTHALHV